jgi:hypothetical protein
VLEGSLPGCPGVMPAVESMPADVFKNVINTVIFIFLLRYSLIK